MDVRSGESKAEEVMVEGIGEYEMELSHRIQHTQNVSLLYTTL